MTAVRTPLVGEEPPAPAADETPVARPGLRGWAWPVEWLVFAVALVTRLTVILRHGSFRSLFGYDSGVYFAGADSLVHGRLPYADYVQLHPPAITIVLAPFALLTHVMSDSASFDVAISAFVLLGALNAVLVVRVCRGLGRAGAAAGGLFYALWVGSVDAEYLIKLEPLANAFILCALLLALRAQRRPQSRWASVLAGVPLGLAVSVKIWWIVPVLAIVGWHVLRSRSLRNGGLALAGTAAATVVVNLPFFVAAPRQMWSMVVLDQLARPRTMLAPTRVRLETLAGVTWLRVSPGTKDAVLALVVVLAVLAAAGAWRRRITRPAVVLVALQGLVVLAAPSWFPYYCDYLAVGAAVVVAGAVATPPARDRVAAWTRIAGVAFLVPVTAVTVVALDSTLHLTPFPAGPALARAVASDRCVMTDSPAVQIRLDALSRGLADGCPNWVDVTGPTYGPYRASVPRAENRPWQRAFLAYLRQGQVVVFARPGAAGATHAVRAELVRDGHRAVVHGMSVYYPGR